MSLINGLIEEYTMQGRGCGCPGDDLLEDQARYLLGVHRALPEAERAVFGKSLEHALEESVLAPPTENDLLSAFAVAGLILELPAATVYVERQPDLAREALFQRAEALGHLWKDATNLSQSAQDVLKILQSSIQNRHPSSILAHVSPQILAETWKLTHAPEGRALILHVLGDRSELERRTVEIFLSQVLQELMRHLPGVGRTLWNVLTGWLSRSQTHDVVYLEAMRCLGCVKDLELRRDFLARCALHPSKVVARRAVRQLFLEAEASSQPAAYRPVLERLAKKGPRFLRQEAEYAVSLLAPPTKTERLEQLAKNVYSRKNRRKFSEIYHLDFLEASSLKPTMEPGLAPDCAACKNRCCSGPACRISLRLTDIVRLKEEGLEWAIETEKKSYTDEEKKAHPHLARLEKDRTYQWFPVLRQKEDGTCIFYDQNGQCSIYEHRPLQCRSFPYQIELQSRTIQYSDRCQSKKLDLDMAKVMAAAVVQNFNAKIQDLLLVHQEQKELEALDLFRFLSLRNDPPE